VIDSVENNKVAAWYNNTRTINLTCSASPAANTVQVVNSIQGAAAQLP